MECNMCEKPFKMEKGQLTQTELWRLANFLDPYQKHKERKDLLWLVKSLLYSIDEAFVHHMTEDVPETVLTFSHTGASATTSFIPELVCSACCSCQLEVAM